MEGWMDGWEQLLLLLHTQSSNLSALADFQLNLIFNPKHKIKSIKLSLSCFLNKFEVIFFSFYGRLISNQSKWRISLLRHHPQSLTAPPLELGRTSKHAPPPPISWQSDEIDRSSDSTSAPKFEKGQNRYSSLFMSGEEDRFSPLQQRRKTKTHFRIPVVCFTLFFLFSKHVPILY